MEPGELEEGEALPDAGPAACPPLLELVLNGEALRVSVARAGTGEASAALSGERLNIASFWNPGAAVASAMATLLLGGDRSDVWVVEGDAADPSPSVQKLHADCLATGKTVRNSPCSQKRSAKFCSTLQSRS